MQGYAKINLRDMPKAMDEERLNCTLAEFSCPYNKDVEDFLHVKAREFSKQQLATTYLIFASYRGEQVLVGYFTLSIKYFHIDLKRPGRVSSKLRRRIGKFAKYDDDLKKSVVSALLIAQLGKNYSSGHDQLITGDELLKIACDTVMAVQRMASGKIVYLECEDTPSLIKFYERNGFTSFGIRELDGDETSKFKGKHLVQMLKYLGD